MGCALGLIGGLWWRPRLGGRGGLGLGHRCAVFLAALFPDVGPGQSGGVGYAAGGGGWAAVLDLGACEGAGREVPAQVRDGCSVGRS